LFPLAAASGQAEVEYAKGLIAYDEHDYLTALESFRRVVMLDPTNPHAHFYLGLSLSRLAEFPEAITVLHQALVLDASLRYVHYHLGVAYFQEGRYPEALEQFILAEQFDPGKATTQFYLGYTHYLLKHYHEALPFFQQAMRLDPALSLLAQYYQGVVLYTLERDSAARAAFLAVISTTPDATVTANAQRYLAVLAAREREQRLWQVEADLSLQYDDNVTLESNGQVVDFGRRGDTNILLTVGARLVPVRTPLWRLGAEYTFFQSQHFTLHAFDLQSHTGTLLVRRKWDGVLLRVATDYTYTLLDNADFSAEVGVLPSVTFWESDTLYTVASVRYRHSRFFNQALDAAEAAARDRDGGAVRVGFDQYLLFNGKRAAARLSYYAEGSRNSGTDWEYNGQQVGLGLYMPLWWGLMLSVDGFYQYRDYLHTNSFATEPLGVRDAADRRTRRDDIFSGTVALTRDLGRYLTLSVAFTHTDNLSNVAFFDYRRNLTTLTLSGRY
jgi:tetratricopeptide (TPR) repeat protein